jgi:predicted HTH transcriptional regulator
MATKRGPDMSRPHYDEVYQVVCEQRKPFATTTEVADRFDTVSRRTIQDRLNELVRRGELEKRVIGSNTAVWFEPPN